MSNYKTEEEAFWASQEWASDYIDRVNKNVSFDNVKFFSDIFSRCTKKINSVLEFGSNIGINLAAINKVFKNLDISAIEISDVAVKELEKKDFINKIYHGSMLDVNIEEQRDFVFTKVVLIHINPDFLDTVYEKLYNSSSKYILIAEYYNPTPVTVVYRGNKDKLYKRDFAGEMLDKYPDLELVDYKFNYHRDSHFPQDDVTWFLLQKK